ncbi:hypothetical protein [Pelagibacterium lentulum]|uniref:GlsB/YeaQ/YmgE family stress response membrane protein n=1 Tax=Pelagibacterium lentulum TaxID=2029865 RepID=A0A916RD03_9HYPH|nr:hypothetical protein [Pelagibacterium lentulum]GGA52660.1 hypothetical protein GCM10011499_23430 [Pelagibacterium lentulum]
MNTIASHPMMVWLLVGFATGLFATFAFTQGSVWRYLAAGVAGAVIVSYLTLWAGIQVPISDWLVRHIAISTLGALSVIVVARVFD